MITGQIAIWSFMVASSAIGLIVGLIIGTKIWTNKFIRDTAKQAGAK